MTARRLAGPVTLLLVLTGTAAAQPSSPPTQLPPGSIVTPGTVFVPAGGQPGGGVVVAAPATPQMPARDVAGPAPTGTGVISGRITEADTGRPIRRATVQVTGRGASRDPRVTSTNDDGRFAVRDLASGEFLLSVRKPGYVSAGYGVKSEMEMPRPLRLADKEVFDKADIALERGGVVTGRVVDEYGEPVLDASVRVMRKRFVQGKQQLLPAGNSSQTNDIGEYRIFGLPPGDYYVSTSMRGDFSRSESDDEMGYAATYYPGTVDVATAQPVRVVVGTQTQADITLQPIKLGRVLGLLLDSVGRPAASGRVMGRRIEEGVFIGGMDMGGSATVKPDGSFTINALVPGRYSLQGMAGAAFMMGSGVTEAADATVDVIAGEISTVTLSVSKGGTIRGRVVVDGTPIDNLASFSVMAAPVSQGGVFGGVRPTAVAADGTFELVGVRGAVNLRLIGGAQGAVLKAVRNGVADVTPEGITVASGRTLSGVEIHVTKDVAELSGTVTGARGEMLTNYFVVIFHEDQKRWFSGAGRGYMVARPDQDGRYTSTGFLAGTYLAVALQEFDATTFGDPSVMESLRGMATEVTLSDGEKRVLNLRLAAQ